MDRLVQSETVPGPSEDCARPARAQAAEVAAAFLARTGTARKTNAHKVFAELARGTLERTAKGQDAVFTAVMLRASVAPGVTHGPLIPPQQQLLLYSPDQWEGFVQEWLHYCFKKAYKKVQRFSGPGDMGIDVAGFADANKRLMGVWDKPVPELSALTVPALKSHFHRQREAFYQAEALRVFARDSVPEGTFESLQQDIFDGVIDSHDATHPDGYQKVCAVTKAAREVQITANALITCTQPKDRDGTPRQRLRLCRALLAQARCLALPHPLVAMPRPASDLGRRLGLDPPTAQPLRKGLAPAAQVFLARVEALPVATFGPYAQVHVRIGLVGVQHHHVAVIRQLGLGELARGALQEFGFRARRHRQHDVESLAAFADLRDARAAQAPLVHQIAQRFLAFVGKAPVVLDGQPAISAARSAARSAAGIGSGVCRTSRPTYSPYDRPRPAALRTRASASG